MQASNCCGICSFTMGAKTNDRETIVIGHAEDFVGEINLTSVSAHCGGKTFHSTPQQSRVEVSGS